MSRMASRRVDWRIAAVLVLALVSIILWNLLGSHRSQGGRENTTEGKPVAVSRVARMDLFNQVTYPAEFRPYQEVEVHAKVSGFVKDMNVDFGDRVKAGQILATLEVPELLDQLHNALAVEKRAEADYPAAHSNYTRLLAVAKTNPNLVAEQDLDTARAKDGAAEAAIAAAKAEADRYRTLVGYTQITAPFDGVITHRFVDKGALIQAGTQSDTQSLPLVRVSDNYHLRLDFPVSVAYVKDVHQGDTVDVFIESLGSKRFKGSIKRFTMKVNEATRTMMTEIEVDNPTLEIVPGMYANVALKVQSQPGALSIPTQAVSGDKNTVYVVNSNNEIEERPVTLGLETPNRYEVKSGLQEGDLVMIGNRTQVRPGQKVIPKVIESLAYE
jgi:RND family efflux transporter MFP subunit